MCLQIIPVHPSFLCQSQPVCSLRDKAKAQVKAKAKAKAHYWMDICVFVPPEAVLL